MPEAEPRIVYTPRSDATPESELNALTAVYRFILFESLASKKAARPDGPEDGTKVKEDSAYARNIPRGK